MKAAPVTPPAVAGLVMTGAGGATTISEALLLLVFGPAPALSAPGAMVAV